MDYRKYIGQVYEAPHGCFYLVADCLQELHSIYLHGMDHTLQKYDPKLPATRQLRAQVIHQGLAELGVEVSPMYLQEGDVVLIRSNPYHMGIVVDPSRREMLHSYKGGTSCIERFDSILWRNRILGFWRYRYIQ